MISDHAVELTDKDLPSYHSVRRQGSGRIAVVQTHGRSVVRSAYATSPLRLLTPKNHGHAAWIYTSNYGGGLVDGDVIAIQATVGARAMAFLSTQSATKVYRSPHGTEVELRAAVEDEGVLVSMPDAVVCFAGARYRQTQRVNLTGGAGLILVDWMTSGRRESGERWAFNEYLSRTIIHLDGHLKVYDSLALRASDGKLATRLKPYDVLAVVVVIGQLFQEHSEQIMAQVQAEEVKRSAARVVTVAPINGVGCVLRIAGRSVEEVDHALRDFLHFVPRFLGDNPWARKW